MYIIPWIMLCMHNPCMYIISISVSFCIMKSMISFFLCGQINVGKANDHDVLLPADQLVIAHYESLTFPTFYHDGLMGIPCIIIIILKYFPYYKGIKLRTLVIIERGMPWSPRLRTPPKSVMSQIIELSGLTLVLETVILYCLSGG